MSPYIRDAAMVAAMAREFRVMQSRERRGLASLLLVVAGFSKPDVSEYLDRAIANERARRLALPTPRSHANAL